MAPKVALALFGAWFENANYSEKGRESRYGTLK